MPTETLRQKQSRFVKLVAMLIEWAYANGYELTFGEAYEEPDEVNPEHMKNSLHGQRLAIDLNLFKDGKYLQKSKDHKPLGVYWESLAPDCRWGGRFGDGNHYSLEHNGVK